MTDSNADLNAKYLEGDANADDVQRLEQALTDDPECIDALMSDAFMEVHLRELLCGSELGASISQEMTAPSPIAPQLPSKRWTIAAMLLAAITGWALTFYVAGRLGKANTHIGELSNRITELEKADNKSAPAIAQDAAPQIHSTRGWLMALPPDNDTEGETLFVGATAPLDQRLWTCPWGAAEFRYESGVAISIERNTTVKLNETDDLRTLSLERGIVHVTNSSDVDKRVTEIKCALATVRLVSGQVAVQVSKHLTAVEAAVGQVDVLVNEGGVTRTINVRRGQYLTIQPGEETRVTNGMLKLGLEPPGN